MPATAQIDLRLRIDSRFAGDHRAPGHLMGKKRHRFAVKRGPHPGMQPIRTNQNRRIVPFLSGNHNMRRMIAQAHLADLPVQLQCNPRLRGILRQCVDEISAMDQPVVTGRAKPFQIEPCDPAAGFTIQQSHRPGAHRDRADRFAQPHDVQDPGAVGRDLQPRTDFGDRRGLFKKRHFRAMTCQKGRNRQPGDPRPQNRYLLVLQHWATGSSGEL